MNELQVQMKAHELMKNIGEKSFSYFSKVLNLPKIEIQFDSFSNFTYLGRTDYYRNKIPNIMINLEVIYKASKNKEYLESRTYNTKIEDCFDLIIHTVAHELAHCVQVIRHIKWSKKFIKQYYKQYNHKEYIKFKMEVNANKIADILVSRLNIQYS